MSEPITVYDTQTGAPLTLHSPGWVAQQVKAGRYSYEPIEAIEPDPEPRTFATVAGVRAWLDKGPAPADVELALDAERNGENRKTAVAAMEDYLV